MGQCRGILYCEQEHSNAMTKIVALVNRLIFSLVISVLPCAGWAQQNLFNVPSSDITEKNKIFFQQQFNIGSVAGNSNTTIDYGLGNNLEIGINLFNLDLYPTNSGIHNPHFLVNIQKAFDITDSYKMSFGTQTGITPPLYHSNIAVPSFSYLNNAFDLERWGKYYLGVYYANHAYAGPGNNVGLMAGVDFPIFKGKVHLMGDLMTGNNDISVGVVGAVFYLPNNWQLSFGAQLPAPGSNNDYGMVFEITKL
jgi:hypothetical protein